MSIPISHPLKTKDSQLKIVNRTENLELRNKLLLTPKTKNYLPKTHPLKTKDSRLKTTGFTLVELIVVIVILAILATIAFLSFSSQSGSARDSTRLSDIASIKKGFEMYNVNSGIYPTPDTPTSVTYSGGTLWNQGTLGENAYRLIKQTLSKKVTDPLKSTEYDYSLASNKREYQIAGNLENPTSLNRNNYNPFELSATSFQLSALGGTGTNVYISGNYNGVLLKVFTGSTYYYLPVPTLFAIANITQYDSNTGSGKIILPGNNTTAIFNSNQIYSTGGSSLATEDILPMMKKMQLAYSGSNVSAPAVSQLQGASDATLSNLGGGLVKNVLGGSITTTTISQVGSSASSPGLSCNDIKSKISSSDDGIYWIKPDINSAFQVYCDMTSDGGGWTLVMTGLPDNLSSSQTLVNNRNGIMSGTYTIGNPTILSNQSLISPALYSVNGNDILLREQGMNGFIKSGTKYGSSEPCLNDGQSRSIGFWFAKGLPVVAGGYARACNRIVSLNNNMWANSGLGSEAFIFMTTEADEYPGMAGANYAFLSVRRYSAAYVQQGGIFSPQPDETDQGFITTDGAYNSANAEYGSNAPVNNGGAGHLFIR